MQDDPCTLRLQEETAMYACRCVCGGRYDALLSDNSRACRDRRDNFNRTRSRCGLLSACVDGACLCCDAFPSTHCVVRPPCEHYESCMGGAAAVFARNRDCLEIPPMQCERRRRAMIFSASASKIFQRIIDRNRTKRIAMHICIAGAGRASHRNGAMYGIPLGVGFFGPDAVRLLNQSYTRCRADSAAVCDGDAVVD
jgi:hypothetical protein